MIGAIQNRKIFPIFELRALRHFRACSDALNPCNGTIRLMLLVVCIHNAHRLAFAQIAPQLFRKELRVGADHVIRRPQNRTRGAIVLLQLDHLERGEINRELFQVIQRCTAPAVDRLIVIAHGGEAGFFTHHFLQKLILHGIRVLVFIDQDMREFLSPNLRRMLMIL